MFKGFLTAFAIACLVTSQAFAQTNATDMITNPPSVGLNTGHVISAASTNSTSVKGSRTTLYHIDGLNTNAATAYLKLYNKATAPTCNTDTVVKTVPMVQNIPVEINIYWGAQFSAGLGICITGAIADNDNTNATTGIAVNLNYR